jgi:hypothetical protein
LSRFFKHVGILQVSGQDIEELLQHSLQQSAC